MSVARFSVLATFIRFSFLMQIPTVARDDFLVRFRIYSDSECRICSQHLAGSRLAESVDWNISDQDEQYLCPSIRNSTSFRQRERHFPLDFNYPYFTDNDCLIWTGWTRAQFQSMLDCLNSTNNSSKHDKSTALLMFWVKLRKQIVDTKTIIIQMGPNRI